MMVDIDDIFNWLVIYLEENPYCDFTADEWNEIKQEYLNSYGR